MNLHLPQSILTETELRHLAATPYQIVNPSSSKPLIAIFQDSLLGAYRFTRPDIKFTPRDAMNLLMGCPNIDVQQLQQWAEESKDDCISNFQILSQITPPITLKYKTGLFDDNKDDDKDPKCNNVLEIRAGQYIRGQMEKGVFESASKGIIHRINNDFGAMACADYNDHFQSIITEYMKTSSFSVGISDLIADRATNEKIADAIRLQKMEVQTIMDKVHIGIFENNTAQSNQQHFELMVTNVLNKATEESGKIGKKSLSADNRFLMIVNSGSKGNLHNISQMISCLGQQTVDGKRISYGFDDRTLPHFKKYDDSPNARGFVENSYITGLTAPELFFHAMAGRTGLIDTAVKSVTGDTPILVLDDTRLLYITIGEWIDKKLKDAPTESIELHPEDRNLELLNVNDIYIPTTDERGNVTWGAVTAVTRHDPSDKLYKITTQGGRSVIVPESKSLLIWNESANKFQERLTPEVEIGDEMPVTETLCRPPLLVDEITLDNIVSITLTKDMGIFFGIYLVCGKLYDDFIRIKHPNRDIMNFVRNFMVSVEIPFDQPEDNVVVGDDDLMSFTLEKLFKNRNQIDADIFAANDDFIIGLLTGYFSSCANIWENTIRVSAKSKAILDGLAILCNRIGVYGDIFQTVMHDGMALYTFTIHDQWGRLFSNTVRLLDETMQSVLETMVWGQDPDVLHDVVLDRIVTIEEVSPKLYPKLYDLTVPSTNNFGLANGLHVYDTSQTGYIQRRLVKGLEDLMVSYDMTVRNNKGKIIQYMYGDDNFDSTRVENQILPLANMSVEDIYMHFDIPGMAEAENNLRMAIFTKETITRMNKQREKCKDKCYEYATRMIGDRDKLVEKVFLRQSEVSVRVPVAFQYLIQNIQGQLDLKPNSAVDITPLEAFELIEEYYTRLNSIYYAKTNDLFRVLYFYYLTPRDLLVKRHFHRQGLQLLLETVLLKYKEALVHPGEMVGVVAAQSCGEPCTQLSILRSERLKVVRVNKATKIPVMISTEIGELCDQLIHRLPEYTFETGHKDSVETVLDPLEDEYYVIGVDSEEKTHWNKISHVSRHIVNGDMVRVKTRSGRMVETTMSHSLLIRKDQTVKPIQGKDLLVGMRIPVAKHIDNTFMQDKIAIGGTEYKLDYLFGWFIGAYLAEGCLIKKKGTNEATGTISISNVSEYYVENTRQFAARFDRKCRVAHKTNRIGDSEKTYTNTDTSFTYKPLADLIMNTCGTGSFVKHVPDFAFLAPHDFKSGLISGYFDGDGNFMCDKQHQTIRVLSRSKQLIKDMSLLLSYFDIVGYLHTNYRNGDNYYHLTIPPKYSKIYQKLIGTNLHMEKLQTLVDYTEREDIHDVREYIDKINGLGEIIATCGKTLELPGQSRSYGRWTKKSSIGRSTLQKYVELFEAHEKADLIKDELSILRQALYSGVIWDEIVEIEKYTPDQSEYVYDFTVPATQTFMTDYGVIVHNTLNSVTYETEILVKNSKGHISRFQIGDFIEGQIKKSQKIEYMPEKDTTYAELDLHDEYYEVPNATEDGHTVWRRIEAVTRHPVINKDGTNTMLKITTKGCREVTVTKAKSLLQLVDGKLQEVAGDSVKVGDYLPCSRKPLEFTEITQLDLRDILPPTEYIYGTEMAKAAAVCHEYHWWRNHAKKTFTIPYARSDIARSYLRPTGTRTRTVVYEEGCVYTKSNNICNYRVPEIIDLDYDFGYLVGAYAAEGCMTKHQISIANNEREFFVPIERLCKKYNLTTKQYVQNNKGKEGWTSSDIRIYSTVMCRILEKLCGKLSHGKFVSPHIVFSNKECIRGFLDSYISGDGSVYYGKKREINAASVSYPMLLDIQIMLKNIGIVSSIRKHKKKEGDVVFPTYTTKAENVKQPYGLYVLNQQCQKLATILNLTVPGKQERVLKLREHPFKHEFGKKDLEIPYIIKGKTLWLPRDGDFPDIEFDPIVSIEEVPNTTNYAYDLTVEETRNFDCMNAVSLKDTFHSSGIASKSNVTRGVPRIEEILRLTKNPKNPSMTVALKPLDETNKETAQELATWMTHTKLVDVVKSVKICFDPNPTETQIVEDQLLLEQFFEFENMIKDCMGDDAPNDPARSKWILRMELDEEALLDKNITMDDIHFAIANSEYGKDVHCLFSDHNMEKLVFRIRTNGNVFDKSKRTRGSANPLDQSDDIYLLKNFQDTLLNNIVLRGVHGIQNVLPRKIQNSLVKESDKYVQKETWVLDTTGSNLLDALALDYIDFRRTISNDIKEVFHVLGIEAARQCIQNELVEVLAFSGASVNYHHTSLLCDRMTCNKDMVSIFRSGILNDDIGPVTKSTFEVHTEVLLNASRHAELDHMRGVSANIMCGQQGTYGTNSFQVILDMKALEAVPSTKYQSQNQSEDIERGLAAAEEMKSGCSNIEIQNNIQNIKHGEANIECLDDGYNAGF